MSDKEGTTPKSKDDNEEKQNEEPQDYNLITNNIKTWFTS